MAAYTVFLAILLYLGIIAGLFVLFVYICGSICRSRGLPASYKWFGLLGVIGIIVVAVITPPYNPYYPPYTPPPPYQQPGPQGQPPYGPESRSNSEPSTMICPNCGRENNVQSNFCASCGVRLK